MKTIVAFLLALINGAAMAEQVKIVGGIYPLYGSAKKPVKVSSFSMDIAPVTNAEFLTFVNSHPEWSKPSVSPIFAEAEYLRHWSSPTELGPNANPDGPVVNVSWFAAKAFVNPEACVCLQSTNGNMWPPGQFPGQMSAR